MKNFVESNIEKLAFDIAKNFIFKGSSKTKEIPFLHSNVNGLILPPFMNEEKLRDCTTFTTRPSDVFLVTYPKSGTTWLSHIVRCIVKPKESGQENLVGGTVPMFEAANHKQLEALSSPRCMFTHLPFSLVPRSKEHDLKYIYLARNPKDVAVSIFHFVRSVPLFKFDAPWAEFLEHFMKGNIPGGSYFDHVLSWWSRKDDENVLFLKYEDLKKDLPGQIKIIAEFLGVKLSDEEAKAVAEKCTLQAMKSNPNLDINKFPLKFITKGSHLRKGIVGDWKNHFSDEQLEAFDRLCQSRLNGTGLEFQF